MRQLRALTWVPQLAFVALIVLTLLAPSAVQSPPWLSRLSVRH
jgi:hypothetical protein